MRIETTIAGEKLVWENGRKAQMRAEIALSMPWEQIANNVAVSTAIKAQVFYSGFSYPDGKPVPEDVIDRLAEEDGEGVKALMLAMAAEAKSVPLATAPLSGSSASGAPLASSLPTTGKAKTGKSTKSSRGARSTSGKPKNKG